MNICLRDILKICDSGTWGNDPDGSKDDFPVVRVADINEYAELRTKGIPYRNISADKQDKYLLRNGDLIVVKSSGSHAKIISGRTAIIEGENSDKFMFSNFLLRLRPDENKIFPKYLWFYLNSNQAKAFIKSIIGPTTYPNLKGKEYLKMPIPVPSLFEQNRIVNILEKTNALRKKRWQADNINDALKRSVFYKMFNNYLNGAIDSKGINLGNVISIGRKLVDPRNPEYQSLPHINGEVIESKTGKLLQYNKVSEEKLISSKFIFEENDVLYNKIRPYLCKATIPGFRGLCSADMYPITPDTNNIVQEYLLWLLLSDEFTSYAIQCSTRARMPKLNREELFAFRITLPPLSEQKKFADLVHKSENIKEKQQEFKKDSDNLFNSLMQKAFSGA